jgi:hypothetical protein
MLQAATNNLTSSLAGDYIDAHYDLPSGVGTAGSLTFR